MVEASLPFPLALLSQPSRQEQIDPCSWRASTPELHLVTYRLEVYPLRIVFWAAEPSFREPRLTSLARIHLVYA